MACKTDVRSAILDKVMDELVEGRYTFQRLSDDSIMVNGKVDEERTQARSNKQALAIAKELADRTEESFYGHVKGEVSQASKFDPVRVQFKVSDAYINHVYNSLPNSQRTDNKEIGSNQRDFINSGTGPNTHEQLSLFDVGEETAGVFTKYIQFKQGLLNQYENLLSKIQRDKKKANLSTEELTKLNNKERQLKLDINGSFELGTKGLKQELLELKKNADVNAVGPYVEKDLHRLNALANSSDLDDLQEAQRLIDFYELAGTFRTNVENPFFSQDEIFLKDDNDNLTAEFRLPQETIDKYKEWGSRATSYRNILDTKKKELTVNTVNDNPQVKNTYGDKKFSFGDLTSQGTGLKDVDWISMWTMDITNGIFSHNGMIPQVMFSFLANSQEKKLGWTREIDEKIDHLNPKVQAELSKIEGGKYSLRGRGILGLKGASFQLFKEVTKEGNETGGLVQRFVKEFFDTQSKALNQFSNKFDEARLIEDYGQRSAALNKAFEDMKAWRRKNTIIMDISRLPEFGKINDDTHKKELISILGEKGYKEQVERQQNLLNKYEAEKQSMIDTLLSTEGKDSFDELSDKAKSDMSYWENNHSPFRGIEDFHSVNGISFGDRKANNFMDYNNFIPRSKEAEIKVNPTTNKYEFADTNKETGFYSEGYKTIEGNPVLSEFYDTVKEVCQTVRENTPIELQNQMAVNTIPALMKTSAEMIADKNNGILSSVFEAFRHMMERVRLGFGINKQSEISYATIDPVTGRANYKVNDAFLHGNSRAINERMAIEKAKFVQAINAGRMEENKIKDIKRFTSLQLQTLSPQALVLLANYLHLDVPLSDIQNGRLDAIRRVTGNTVEIGKYIRDFSLHSVVQSQSFDLAKITKYFAYLTMQYAARQEALPILQIMKQHYEGIQKPRTNNLNNSIYNAISEQNMMDGLRTNGNKQMSDWFERVALGNYSTKHLGPHGKETKVSKLVEDKLTKHIPKYFKDIYSKEDKAKIKEINELLKNETDEKKRKQLEAIRDSLGKTRTATAFFDNFMGMIRTLRLGYNLSSATTNFMEGVTSNVILGAMGEYFDPKEIYYGYRVIKHSFLKSMTFGTAETALAKKNRSLMDKFNVLMDSKNELQKSSHNTYSDKLESLNPYHVNSRVEYINQSPIMIAMLRSTKIKDQNGNESSVWDAYDKHGHLKDEFKTEENVKNWEEMTGDNYLTFKQKLHKAIVIGHGNYDELRGMMIKSNSAGKAMAMFKTWLPMAIYWRFATEQDDIQGGTIGYKGRYWSYTPTTAAIHGATVAGLAFGPVGFLAGGAVGGLLGGFFGVRSEVAFTKEIVDSTQSLVKKILGVPVNLLAGKQIINTDNKEFEKWVGTGKFTAQDAKNLRGNMADISMQLSCLALMLLIKKMLWDDNDKPNDPERVAHNILVNKLMQLSSQAGSYSNYTLFKTMVQDNAVVEYLKEVAKEVHKVQGFFNGKDIAASGPNAGQSQLWAQTKKMVMPGIFKDRALGFGNDAQKVFEETPYHQYFKSAATKDKETNKSLRAERQHELMQTLNPNDFEGDTPDEQLKNMKKAVRKQIDEELPTPTKLNKLEMTREEYDKERVETQN